MRRYQLACGHWATAATWDAEGPIGMIVPCHPCNALRVEVIGFSDVLCSVVT
jgi:hypothetical protein